MDIFLNYTLWQVYDMRILHSHLPKSLLSHNFPSDNLVSLDLGYDQKTQCVHTVHVCITSGAKKYLHKQEYEECST